MTNWIQRTREKARTHFKRGQAVVAFKRNPYKTGVKVMLPIIIVLLLVIIVGFFVIKAGAALLVGKEKVKHGSKMAGKAKKASGR